MSAQRTLKQRLAAISRLRAKEDYDKALVEVETALESWPGNAHLHVLKAALIQLQESPTTDLEEAKTALQQAVELGRESPEAWIELGYFLDNVKDSPRDAADAFAEGVSAARHHLIEGLIGQAKAFRQLDRQEEFKRCLLEILLLTHFETLLSGDKADELQTDVRFHSPFGHVHAAMFNGIPWIRFFTSPNFKGPYAEAVQELLSELGDER